MARPYPAIGRFGASLLGLALCACASTTRGSTMQSSGAEAHFQRVEEISVAPQGSNALSIAQAAGGPRYPKRARNEGRGDRLVVAYVVDAKGRVERPTISLVVAPQDNEFFESICRFLTDVRYTHRGQPGRLLVVQPFNFGLNLIFKAPAPTPRELMAEIERLEEMPIKESVAWLETQPHCP